MSEDYRNAAEEVKGFFVHFSTHADAMNAKINAYAERAGRITKQGNQLCLMQSSKNAPLISTCSLSELKGYSQITGATLSCLQEGLLNALSRLTLIQMPERRN